MPTVTLFFLLAGFGYGACTVLSKTLSAHVSPVMLLTVVSFLCGLLGAGYLVATRHNLAAESYLVTPQGAALAFVLAACAVGAEYFYLRLFHEGAPLNIVAPGVAITALLSAVVFGMVVFKESLNLDKGIGIALGIAAIYFLTRGAR